MHQDLELLAPAGDWASLEAALDAGADAVYFGLRTLNARRRAKNFSPDEFVKAVETVHARGAKAYLTLNIDLAERELGQAARILELARQCRADAVLVRDPALLALRREYPEIEFHFSTQTCMANSADAAAAAKLGANRVVLAREMTLSEIAAASAVPGVKTEVFVQGALCFSVSGRCLLSSWAGGRSGNRGACTSPCRVPWSMRAGQFIAQCNVNEEPAGTPLSMKDLSLIDRLPDLRRAGVTALKIEGRLKNAAWVSRAVSLFKRALAAEKKGTAEAGNPFSEEAGQLGAYTGRTLTSAYLDGQRDDLTAQAEGRQLSAEVSEDTEKSSPLPSAEDIAKLSPLPTNLRSVPGEGQGEGSDAYAIDEQSTYDLRLMIEPKGIACSCVCGLRAEQWTIPKTVIRRPHKAVAIGTLFDQLDQGTLQGFQLGRRETNDPEFLLTPRAANALTDRISGVIRLAQKSPDEMVHIDLPSAISNRLIPGQASQSNCLYLGKKPDRARLDAKDVPTFLQRVRPKGIIVEGLTGNTLGRIRAMCENVELVAALPQVFFEDDIPQIKKLLTEYAQQGVTVEVNSWGGWLLATEAHATMEAGPGLPVLNSLAAQLLMENGMKCVTLSPEADRRQLEDLTAHCPAPCSLIVFGRPPLMTTRVQVPKQFLDQVLTDRRDIQIIPRRERGLYVFRPVDPFDLRGLTNERIRVQHLVIDLVGSDDPLGDWQNAPLSEEETFRFNYDRALA
ncbi:MAG: peptidase U32 family protein [Thermoguttaceae bacterium]|jgi:collagenase-like PrtC family protease